MADEWIAWFDALPHHHLPCGIPWMDHSEEAQWVDIHLVSAALSLDQALERARTWDEGLAAAVQQARAAVEAARQAQVRREWTDYGVAPLSDEELAGKLWRDLYRLRVKAQPNEDVQPCAQCFDLFPVGRMCRKRGKRGKEMRLCLACAGEIAQ